MRAPLWHRPGPVHHDGNGQDPPQLADAQPQGVQQRHDGLFAVAQKPVCARRGQQVESQHVEASVHPVSLRLKYEERTPERVGPHGVVGIATHGRHGPGDGEEPMKKRPG
uniref:Uncharacterized protein n=1 Tax=Kocuria rosea subsp. polaris TaxID=136273 RepID=A0A0A6VP68_KOCRO|nr:hypothetical protein GY22_16870 [Kocuria polaris]